MDGMFVSEQAVYREQGRLQKKKYLSCLNPHQTNHPSLPPAEILAELYRNRKPVGVQDFEEQPKRLEFLRSCRMTKLIPDQETPYGRSSEYVVRSGNQYW